MLKFKQSLAGQLLLWSSIAVLALANCGCSTQSQTGTITDLSISNRDILTWLTALDRSAKTFGGGEGTGRRPDSRELEFNYHISFENSTAEQALDHIQDCFIRHAKQKEWTVAEDGNENDSFNLTLTKGVTQFQISGNLLPVTQSSLGDKLKSEGKSTTRIQVVQLGRQLR